MLGSLVAPGCSLLVDDGGGDRECSSTQWLHTAGGDGIDGAEAIAVDESCNVLVCGSFDVSFPLTAEIQLETGGETDAYAIKLSGDGEIEWARSFGGDGVDTCTAAAADDGGAFYIGGEFTGSIEIGDATLTSRGQADLYVAALSASGAVLGTVSFGGPDSDELRDIEVLPDDGLVAVGRVAGETNLPCDSDPCAASLNGQGFATWLGTDLAPEHTVFLGSGAGGSGEGADRARAVATAPDGTVYVAGTAGTAGVDWSVGGCEFDGGRVTRDGFVAKFAADRSCAWLEQISSSSAVDVIGLDAVETDAGDVAVAGVGVTRGDIAFDGATIGEFSASSAYGFAFRLTDRGSNATQSWLRYIGTAGSDGLGGVAIDPDSGGVFVVGNWGGGNNDATLELGGTVHEKPGNEDNQDTSLDIIVARLGPQGDPVDWSIALGGDGEDGAFSLALKQGRVFVHGSFSSTADLLLGSETSAGASDLFTLVVDSTDPAPAATE